MNIFESASRNKLRFRTSKGFLSTEDLWGLSLQSLDRVGKNVKQEIRDLSEGMLTPKVGIVINNELKLSIIKHIIDKKEFKDTVETFKETPEEIL